MKILSQLTVRSSIFAFVGIAAITATILGGLGLKNVLDSEQMSNHLLMGVKLAKLTGTADMMHDALRGTTMEAMLTGPQADEATKTAIRTELQQYIANFNDAIKKIDAQPLPDDIHDSVAKVKPVVAQYTNTASELVEAALENPSDVEAKRAVFNQHFSELEKSLGDVSEMIEKGAEQTLVERDALIKNQRLFTVVGLIASVSVLLVYGLHFTRVLMRRLGAEPSTLKTFANHIADGELYTNELPSQGLTAGSVAQAMLTMRDRMRATVYTIREGAESVACGSEQIASGNSNLATRTEEQAGSLQETAASMDEMTASLRQTADNARLASNLAASACDAARKGGEAVQRVVDTMSDIQTSSSKIAEITNVIDGIAFQTNILALNAAVEAARAGEEGRGFAVVAGEVRQLAQRSAEAAKEIKNLIGQSVEKVSNGSQQVDDAGHTMQDIVEQVMRVNALINEISSATDQQTHGIGNVNQSVVVLDQGTQQNAALVEESAAAAKMLSEQASRLTHIVGIFKLEPHAQPA